MAALTPTDYRELRKAIYRLGAGKEELKALDSIPSESKLLAAFQAFEDFWETNRAALKVSVETALGVSITNPLARKIAAAWLNQKFSRGG